MPTLLSNAEDARVATFLSPEARSALRCVAQAVDVFTPDRFDVEAIHREARDRFIAILGTLPNDQVGTILLLLGEAGSGKTHLARAFRSYAHRHGTGYFGYMQMTISGADYTRYMLQNLISSLTEPHYLDLAAAKQDRTSGLDRLSKKLVKAAGVARADIESLRENRLDGAARAALVDRLVRQVLGGADLASLDSGLIRAMVLLQSGDGKVRNGAIKYLRGESLTPTQKEWLDVAECMDTEDRARDQIIYIGELIGAVDPPAVLILCLDQFEEFAASGDGGERFRAAVQALTAVTSRLRNCVSVIACLEDHYTKFRSGLLRSQCDRIERDQSPVKLRARRDSGEIQAIVAKRMQYLGHAPGATVNGVSPTFPIPDAFLEDLAGQTTRNVIAACNDFREACVLAGSIVDWRTIDRPTPPQPTTGEETQRLQLLWNEFLATGQHGPPDDETDLATLIAETLEDCPRDCPALGELHTDREGNVVRISGRGEGSPLAEPLQLGVCNASPAFGRLGKQLEKLMTEAAALPRAHAPVAIRSTPYQPTCPGTAIATVFAKLHRAGRYVVLNDAEVRAMVAFRKFAEIHRGNPDFLKWRTHAAPLSRLKCVIEILGLPDELLDGKDNRRAPPPAPTTAATRRPTNPSTNGDGEAPQTPNARTGPARLPRNGAAAAHGTGPAETSQGSAATEARSAVESVARAVPWSGEARPAHVCVGTTNDRSQSPVAMPLEQCKTHLAFIGSTNSGKTTAALNLIEQALLNGLPAILVDRKGDLVSYASDSAWAEPLDDPNLQTRREALRARVECVVYTPGRSDGNPISLAVAPAGLRDVAEAERHDLTAQAASSLAAMLKYGETGAGGSKRAVLVKAIDLVCRETSEAIGLEMLTEYIDERDTSLMDALQGIQPRYLADVVGDLRTIGINRASLFSRDGEALDANRLFGLGPFARAGKTRLSVVSTKFLGDGASIQFWVTQLLVELSRWSSKCPCDHLQCLVLFDEADLYLPAVGKPSTKEPMEGLLKRARSAGLGLFLATQSPGDFDYKCRENLNTWFIGRVAEERAIRKMRPMLDNFQPGIAGKLPGQKTGEFVMASPHAVRAVRSRRSAIAARQIPDHEIVRLATRTRREA